MRQVDSDFYDPLSERVNLFDYAKKLSDKAKNLFLVAEEQVDVAHFAFYLNEQQKSLFITSISIKKVFQGIGLGSYLLTALKRYARDTNYRLIELEVDSRSQSLIHFYKKNEFVEQTRNGNILSLQYRLP
ncbi:acetyltransferase [Methylophaga frappieri]|uniref:Acetyltransferase n=1 Tax=Methylophaga frappieri (strain ATCC BAA-2434 / DSM 25690 / JAM7) TaxID=754477 RepID=I1YG66_METFJ|nr:GNAT family N-acetyltransferase [Methylophaga frappieri]AFJ01909.1 acetyltransferase [Methylophaga frappieri]